MDESYNYFVEFEDFRLMMMMNREELIKMRTHVEDTCDRLVENLIKSKFSAPENEYEKFNRDTTNIIGRLVSKTKFRQRMIDFALSCK